MHPDAPSPEESLARAREPAEVALRLHAWYRGKMQTLPKCPVRGLDDFAIWYTPGVAAPCRAIHADPDRVYEFTSKGNTVAIVSDGSRVLGLGDIGAEAGLPVMEGKALLFKYLGGIDAVPLCLRAREPEELIRMVAMLEPSFGGINLEDISQPKCFGILDQLRATMGIPVWHDDQQGTATVVVAGLTNALKVVGKNLSGARIAMIGMGAANVATYRLLKVAGIDPAAVVACDSRGILHCARADIEAQRDAFADKWRVCQETNAEQRRGGIAEALEGADACIAFSCSREGLIRPEWVQRMAGAAIVFACANPVPEIWPWEALAAGARIVATGRGDFPNQVNNALAFPGIFRGVLDVRARTINDAMAIAAARAMAAFAERRGLTEQNILPTMADWQAVPEIAVATAMQAQRDGIAGFAGSADDIHARACTAIQQTREVVDLLMRHGLIPEAPAT